MRMLKILKELVAWKQGTALQVTTFWKNPVKVYINSLLLFYGLFPGRLAGLLGNAFNLSFLQK